MMGTKGNVNPHGYVGLLITREQRWGQGTVRSQIPTHWFESKITWYKTKMWKNTQWKVRSAAVKLWCLHWEESCNGKGAVQELQPGFFGQDEHHPKVRAVKRPVLQVRLWEAELGSSLQMHKPRKNGFCPSAGGIPGNTAWLMTLLLQSAFSGNATWMLKKCFLLFSWTWHRDNL